MGVTSGQAGRHPGNFSAGMFWECGGFDTALSCGRQAKAVSKPPHSNGFGCCRTRNSLNLRPLLSGPLIILTAAEASGDQHAANLAQALRRRFPRRRLVAFGGPGWPRPASNCWPTCPAGRPCCSGRCSRAADDRPADPVRPLPGPAPAGAAHRGGFAGGQSAVRRASRAPACRCSPTSPRSCGRGAAGGWARSAGGSIGWRASCRSSRTFSARTASPPNSSATRSSSRWPISQPTPRSSPSCRRRLAEDRPAAGQPGARNSPAIFRPSFGSPPRSAGIIRPPRSSSPPRRRGRATSLDVCRVHGRSSNRPG